MPRRFDHNKELGANGFTEYWRPAKRGYTEKCCDCGLVHFHQYRIKDGYIEKRSRRAPRLTAQQRKP